MTDIKARLEKHYARAIDQYGAEAVLGVFLYGSWNYNTNTPDSDVDTKCILVPDVYHLAIKPYETKHLHIWPDSEEKDFEVCECMTIMHMVANWKKQNINFVETLFTDYCIINPLYEAAWKELMPMELREKIGRYNMRQAVNSMAHQALHTIRQDPADPKKIMNGIRIANTLSALLDTDKGYKECIWQDDKVRENRFREPSPVVVDALIYLFETRLADIDSVKQEVFAPGVDRQLEELILNFINIRTCALWY